MSVERNAPEFEAESLPGDGFREPKGQPTALVVDHEPLLRRLLCSDLARLGWRTIEAADGAEALRVGAEADLDLLITDHDMPGIRGIEIADAFRKRLPDLPVVVASGQKTVGQLASSRGYRFIAKPFDPCELLTLVTGIRLDRSAKPTERPSRAQRSEVRKTIPIRNGSARALRLYGAFSGLKPRQTVRDDAERPIGTRTCTLRCYPADDAQFEADINRILNECKRTPTWAGVLEQVRTRIVRLYPGAVVHPRSLLAANGDPNEYWYCYRDGGLSLPRRDN